MRKKKRREKKAKGKRRKRKKRRIKAHPRQLRNQEAGHKYAGLKRSILNSREKGSNGKNLSYTWGGQLTTQVSNPLFFLLKIVTVKNFL